MKTYNLHIKNMVCSRCVWAVEKELKALGADILHIQIGYATINLPEGVSFDLVNNILQELGFKLLEDKEEVIVGKLQVAISDYIRMLENSYQVPSLSEYLSKEIGMNYNYLSKLFSRHESITIETYHINKRIDRVKELLDYDELTLTEIAVKLGYSSVHYLSSQFKRVTGFSVSEFKQLLKSKEQAHKGIKEVMDSLKERGFVYNFNSKEDCLECEENCVRFDLVDLHLNEEYRFDMNSDQNGKFVLYSVQTRNGIKGIFFDTMNEYSNQLSEKLLTKVAS